MSSEIETMTLVCNAANQWITALTWYEFLFFMVLSVIAGVMICWIFIALTSEPKKKKKKRRSHAE